MKLVTDSLNKPGILKFFCLEQSFVIFKGLTALLCNLIRGSKVVLLPLSTG